MPKVNESHHPLPRGSLLKTLPEHPILALERTPVVDPCRVLVGVRLRKEKPPTLARRGLLVARWIGNHPLC